MKITVSKTRRESGKEAGFLFIDRNTVIMIFSLAFQALILPAITIPIFNSNQQETETADGQQYIRAEYEHWNHLRVSLRISFKLFRDSEFIFDDLN